MTEANCEKQIHGVPGCLELTLPSSLLDICQMLSVHPAACTYMAASTEQGVTVNMKISYQSDMFTLLFETNDDSVNILERVSELNGYGWRCSVMSMTPLDPPTTTSELSQHCVASSADVKAESDEHKENVLPEPTSTAATSTTATSTAATSSIATSSTATSTAATSTAATSSTATSSTATSSTATSTAATSTAATSSTATSTAATSTNTTATSTIQSDSNVKDPCTETDLVTDSSCRGSCSAPEEAGDGKEEEEEEEEEEDDGEVEVKQEKQKTPPKKTPRVGFPEPQICQLCQQKLPSWAALDVHVNVKHKLAMGRYRAAVGMLPIRKSRRLRQPKEKNIEKNPETKIVQPESGRSKTPGSYPCNLCNRKYVHAQTLTRHLLDRHRGSAKLQECLRKLEQQLQPLYKGKSKLQMKCPVCDQQLFGKRCIAHMRTWHPDHPDFEEITADMFHQIRALNKTYRKKDGGNASQKFKCECGKLFNNKRYLGKHFMLCPTNPERRKHFNCTVCSARFATQKGYTEHMQQHKEQDTKYICDACGRVFATRTGLLQHTRRVHNVAKVFPIRYHACNICGKSFFLAHGLKRHKKVHSAVVTDVCEICGKGFRSDETLKRHVRTVHHNIYRYHCEKCGHGMQRKLDTVNHVCGRIKRRPTQEGQSDNAPPRTNKSRKKTACSLVVQSETDCGTTGEAVIEPAQENPTLYFDEMGNQVTAIIEEQSQGWTVTEGTDGEMTVVVPNDGVDNIVAVEFVQADGVTTPGQIVHLV